MLIGSVFEKQLKNRLPTQINDSETLHGRRCYNSDNPSLNIICRKDGKHSCLIIPHDQMSREGQQAGARIPRTASIPSVATERILLRHCYPGEP